MTLQNLVKAGQLHVHEPRGADVQRDYTGASASEAEVGDAIRHSEALLSRVIEHLRARRPELLA
jgi:hypothetical protein